MTGFILANGEPGESVAGIFVIEFEYTRPPDFSCTLWVFRNRLSLSCVYGRNWITPNYNIHDNGGRKANECFDLNINIWRLGFSFTLWQIGRWSHILRFLPHRQAFNDDW